MRIIHPRPTLGRQKFIGIEFRDGAADVESLHPEVEASLLQHGYTIEYPEVTLEVPTRKRGRGKALAPTEEAKPIVVFSEPRITITIDGESHIVEKGSAFTAAGLLALTGLDPARYNIRLNTGPGASEGFEEITVEADQQFFTASIAATD